MTRDQQLLDNFIFKEGGKVFYGDNSQGKIISMGSLKFENLVLDNVFLVDGLKHNLIRISQLCDMNHKVCFDSNSCEVLCKKSNEVKPKGERIGNVYMTFHESTSLENCLVSNVSKNTWLWHNRLGHASMNLIHNLVKHDHVSGLPKLKYERDHISSACMKGKQISVSFKPINEISTSRPLRLLHLDLFGPMRTLSLGGKQYVLVAEDDYSRYTWVIFLALNMKPSNHLKFSAKEFKKKKEFVFPKLGVIMQENLKMSHSNAFVKKMV